jgi:hypothetical protein
LVEETTFSHLSQFTDKLSPNVVWSAPRHEWDSTSQL